MSFFSKVFNVLTSHRLPCGPAGYRAYAVGDVHGRLDLLEMLLAEIQSDIVSRGDARNLVVFLGDLIDRGSQSAQVVERLRTWRPENAETIFLCGNHEEVLMRILAGERRLLADWLKYGGAECLASYNLPAESLAGKSEEDALALIKDAIPAEHEQFISTFSDTLRFGDYLFVHAGIRPGVKIRDQTQADLRWIRQPFLEDATDHGLTIVHGHTISETVDERPNRIGLDTGAYRTGVLTAMAVEGTSRWFLDTAPDAEAG